jgi:hypothetical protein
MFLPPIVVLHKANHMQPIEAATFNRKSGGAEGSEVSLSVVAKLMVEKPFTA